jgi:hypothetical protein
LEWLSLGFRIGDLNARTNGGIIGKRNVTSFGKNTIQTKTSSGNLCATQPGTRLVRTAVVAGGAGGGFNAGGGGAGGLREIDNIPVCGGTAYPVTVGAGGAGGTNPSRTGVLQAVEEQVLQEQQKLKVMEHLEQMVETELT